MQTFKITEEHIKLVKKLYIEYEDFCEFGAPAVNPKRPYGNSDVYGDIGEILGIEPNENGEFTDEQYDYMLKLHKELETVLQIIVVNLHESDYIGVWECDDYSINWHK